MNTSALGAFAQGLVGGYLKGEDLNDNRAMRKYRNAAAEVLQAKADRQAELNATLKNAGDFLASRSGLPGTQTEPAGAAQIPGTPAAIGLSDINPAGITPAQTSNVSTAAAPAPQLSKPPVALDAGLHKVYAGSQTQAPVITTPAEQTQLPAITINTANADAGLRPAQTPAVQPGLQRQTPVPHPVSTASPAHKIGFSIFFNPSIATDPATLNGIVNIFAKHGFLKEGVDYATNLYKLGSMGGVHALKQLMMGDIAGAEKMLPPGSKITQVDSDNYRVTLPDGRTFTGNPAVEFARFTDPIKALGIQSTAAKTQSEISKNAAETGLANARTGYIQGVESNLANARAAAASAKAQGSATTGLGLKWRLNLEKSLPKTNQIDASGQPVINVQTGLPVQITDPNLAPTIRNMARVNAPRLVAGQVTPQEAAGTFGEVARLARGDPATMYQTLEQQGRLMIGVDKNGKAAKVVGVMGQYRGADGSVHPILFDFPPQVEKVLVAQAQKNAGAK